MSILKTIQRHGVTLAVFAALTTGLSALINDLTAPMIAHQAALQQKSRLDQVLPPIHYDNDLQAECYIVTDVLLGNKTPHRLYLARRNSHPVAAALESTAPDGYSGAIQLLVGADFSGHVLGVRVLEHHETPGLGDKIELRLSQWIEHFTGQQVMGEDDPRWTVKKEGGMFDQFTGATITPRAVAREVKQTVWYLMHHHQQITQLPRCSENL